MSTCSARLSIKCRDNQFYLNKLAANGLGGVNLEKLVGRARITVVFDKKIPDSDLEGAMELGEKLVRFGIKFDE